MNKNLTIILYYSNTRENARNSTYPHRFEIYSEEDMKNVVAHDHVCAEYKDNHRSNRNFLQSNCVVFDLDNDHSDNPADWKNPYDVQAAFLGVPFYVCFSRNHMKEKGGKPARPRFHVYFPIDRITDSKSYSLLKQQVWEYFNFFDQNALDSARFLFGVENPEVTYFDGDTLLSDFMKTVSADNSNKPAYSENNMKGMKKAMDFQKKDMEIIPEGQRNNTLYRFAVRKLTRYGDSTYTEELYKNESAKCSPPLEDEEVQTIWKSAAKYYHNNIENDPTYIPPEDFRPNSNHSTGCENSVSTKQTWPIKDKDSVKELIKTEPSARKFTLDKAELFLKAFGVTVRKNDMNGNIEVNGLPEEYSGEDAYTNLATLVADYAAKLKYKRAQFSVVYAALELIANKNCYHPVIELLNRKSWDRTDRLPAIYDILGVSDELSKTLVLKWALQSIAVLYNSKNTPVAAQGTLILQGRQGIGKTQFFRHLAIKDDFFKGGAMLDMTNKDTIMSATKVWICELGETDGTTEKKQSVLKGFLTEQVDHYREPYARKEKVRYRKTAFCGTVNKEQYLYDSTGNRRFWTIHVDKFDLDKVFSLPQEWYAQFWRQIQTMYLKDPQSYLLTPDELEQVNKRNVNYEVELDWESEFLDTFDILAEIEKWKFLSAGEVADILNKQYRGQKISSSYIGKTLLPKLKSSIGVKDENDKRFSRKIIHGRKLNYYPPQRSCVENDSTISVPDKIKSMGFEPPALADLDDTEEVTF